MTTTLWQIRRAGPADAPVLAAFNQAMALETENKTLPDAVIQSGTWGLLDQPQYGFYVLAEADGVVVGSLMITFEWSDWRNGLFWWVQSVYVRPEFRRRGVYRALYNWVRDEARRSPQVVGLRLYVDDDNAGAQRTYEALGMTPCHYRLYEETF